MEAAQEGLHDISGPSMEQTGARESSGLHPPRSDIQVIH